jgi:hypothetical protein
MREAKAGRAVAMAARVRCYGCFRECDATVLSEAPLLMVRAQAGSVAGGHGLCWTRREGGAARRGVLLSACYAWSEWVEDM